MDIKQTDLYWFQLNEEIRVEDVDKFSGNNMHPDRMMTQWVLVLMISGERSFRVYGENYVVHSGEFFLLPPYVQHCGLQYDNHTAYFAHFQATGIQVPPPVKVDTNHILLPLHGQIPLELPCFDLMEYAIQHRTLPFSSKNFLSSQIQAILYQISFAVQKRELWCNLESRLAYRILQYIDDNKDQHLRNRDYEDTFGKTYNRLNTIFQTVYGMTIKQMQVTLRVNQAKRMLRSGYTISETSTACGFEDYFYFLKVFKNKTGMTPSEYKNS